jgi:hypothetical protein
MEQMDRLRQAALPHLTAAAAILQKSAIIPQPSKCSEIERSRIERMRRGSYLILANIVVAALLAGLATRFLLHE